MVVSLKLAGGFCLMHYSVAIWLFRDASELSLRASPSALDCVVCFLGGWFGCFFICVFFLLLDHNMCSNRYFLI